MERCGAMAEGDGENSGTAAGGLSDLSKNPQDQFMDVVDKAQAVIPPEIMNGRLAMLGFVAAAGAEIATGETVAQQVGDATTQVVLTILLFTARAAMIGMLALLGFEAVKHVPCL